MRLLLIEDERTLCDAVARRLRRLGYSVDLAYDGEQALQLFVGFTCGVRPRR